MISIANAMTAMRLVRSYLQATSAPLDVIEGLSKVERQLLKDKVASKATKQSKIDTFFAPVQTKIQTFFKITDPAPVVIVVEEVEASDANKNSSTAD